MNPTFLGDYDTKIESVTPYNSNPSYHTTWIEVFFMISGINPNISKNMPPKGCDAVLFLVRLTDAANNWSDSMFNVIEISCSRSKVICFPTSISCLNL